MASQHTKKWILGAAVGASALVGAVGPADAAVYRGTWDPPFGAPLTDLYWKGSATFFVPDTCVGAGPHPNSGPCAGMTVTNAVVELADASAPLVTLQTINFGSAPTVTGTLLDGSNAVIGSYTSFFAGVQGAIPQTQFPTGVGSQLFFSLFLNGTNAFLAYNRFAHDDFSCTALLQLTGNTADCGVSAPAHVTYVPVPEPATYGLMALGLAAVGFVARRRKR